MEQKTAVCGWWGFPNQTYHSGLFVIAKDQEVQVSIGQNVSNAWIESRVAGNWQTIWEGTSSQKIVLLRGEYQIHCGRKSQFDAKASVSYTF